MRGWRQSIACWRRYAPSGQARKEDSVEGTKAVCMGSGTHPDKHSRAVIQSAYIRPSSYVDDSVFRQMATVGLRLVWCVRSQSLQSVVQRWKGGMKEVGWFRWAAEAWPAPAIRERLGWERLAPVREGFGGKPNALPDLAKPREVSSTRETSVISRKASCSVTSSWPLPRSTLAFLGHRNLTAIRYCSNIDDTQHWARISQQHSDDGRLD